MCFHESFFTCPAIEKGFEPLILRKRTQSCCFVCREVVCSDLLGVGEGTNVLQINANPTGAGKGVKDQLVRMGQVELDSLLVKLFIQVGLSIRRVVKRYISWLYVQVPTKNYSQDPATDDELATVPVKAETFCSQPFVGGKDLGECQIRKGLFQGGSPDVNITSGQGQVRWWKVPVLNFAVLQILACEFSVSI